MRDLPSGTVTFLFTDIEGSTRLLRELGEDVYAEALEEHRGALRGAFEHHGGVEVDTQGDAFFVAFADADAALAAADQGQTTLAAGSIRVRMGVHSGAPRVTSEGYVGADVHRAARIAASGHGGQVVVSQATAELVGDAFPLVPLGAHRLRDFDEPVLLYQLGEGNFPPLKALANTNLPAPASSFLGRDRELREAEELLQRTRLLTVTGPGGAGKTRFALELATRAREQRFGDYADGVFACFLSSLRDPELVLNTIAQTLNVDELPGAGALDALVAYLEDKRMLLMLDNLEHVLGVGPELSKLLASSPGLTQLVTSRELLRIGGETDYALPPLEEEDGLQLFCERARVERSDDVVELCRRLDGLPLALELAAARTRLLSPEQLLERLGGRLDLLKAGRAADPRQQTLRATIEWSHALLTADEQELFSRLAVFSGGWTLDAAEEVVDADVDLLQSLLDKSLVRRNDDRFWMLETIREFAAERLVERGEADELEGRHARWCLELVETAERERLVRQTEWGARFDAENDNLRAALAWAGEHDPAIELRIVAAAAYYWLMRARFREGREHLETALARPGDPRVRAFALIGLGRTALMLGDTDAAERALTESLALSTEAGDTYMTARATRILAGVASSAGRVAEAQELGVRALELAEEVGDEWAIGTALGQLSDLALLQGDLARCIDISSRAIAVLRQVGDTLNVAMVTANLALAHLLRGDAGEAERLYGEVLEVGRHQRDPELVGIALLGVATCCAGDGRTERAAFLLGASGSILGEVGVVLPPNEATVRDETIARVTAVLGETAFRAAWERGAAIALASATTDLWSVEEPLEAASVVERADRGHA